jgi:hypothetical protein
MMSEEMEQGEEDSVCCGIVTSYDTWYFLKVTNSLVAMETMNLSLQNSLPTEQSLRTIAGKILAMYKGEVA